MTIDTQAQNNWQEDFSDMIATPAEAVRKIHPGQRVFIGTGCGQPQELVKAMVARSRELPDTEVIDFLTMGTATYAAKELAGALLDNLGEKNSPRKLVLAITGEETRLAYRTVFMETLGSGA